MQLEIVEVFGIYIVMLVSAIVYIYSQDYNKNTIRS